MKKKTKTKQKKKHWQSHNVVEHGSNHVDAVDVVLCGVQVHSKMAVGSGAGPENTQRKHRFT
jgi:hypothetical protein